MSKVLTLVALLLALPAGAAIAGAAPPDQINTCPIYMNYHGRPHLRRAHPAPRPPPPRHPRRHDHP
jgi:hypothetical protein